MDEKGRREAEKRRNGDKSEVEEVKIDEENKEEERVKMEKKSS